MELSRRVRFRFLWINIRINIVVGRPERKMSFGDLGVDGNVSGC
jgi:hypothetical protein